MWTRETKNLKEGFYWYRQEWTNYDGKKMINEMPISVEPNPRYDYPETTQLGDDCCGPGLSPKDMERDNSWVWSAPITPPVFP